MRRRRRIFSIFDGCFIFTIVIVSGILLVTPFLNYNNRALFYFFQKKYGVAEEKWLKALSQNSFSPFYRMNLALNHILLTQSEKAIQEYQVTRNLIKNRRTSENFKIQSRKNQNVSSVKKEEVEEYNQMDDILFYSFFNSAISAHQKGERERALAFYQKALNLRPPSLEVKTNIELLVQNQSSPQKGQKENENSSKKNGKNQKDNQQGAKKQREKDAEQEKKEEKAADSGNKKEENKNKEQSGDKENEKSDQGVKAQDKENKSQVDFSGDQDRRGNRGNKEQNLNPQQTEAILKAILDQERKIRERRHQEQKRPSSIEKDW